MVSRGWSEAHDGGLLRELCVTLHFPPPPPPRRGQLPDFWTSWVSPATAAIYFTLFFALAAAISIASHALLSYESEVRRLSWCVRVGGGGCGGVWSYASASLACRLALLLTAYLCIYIGFIGRSLMRLSTPAEAGAHELSVLIMFFAICGECAQGGAHWMVLQVLLHLVVLIPLAQVDVRTQRGSDVVGAILPLAGWTEAWHQPIAILYFALGGIFRAGALYDCQQATSFSAGEQWWFRVLIAGQ